MIDIQNGKIMIECDCCDEVFEGQNREWQTVWPIAKRDGWKSKKIGEEWVHECPRCAD